jgi:urease accessory protein
MSKIMIAKLRSINSTSGLESPVEGLSIRDADSCPSPITHHPSLSLLRLCQLVSPALPVGAYHFSQSLEYAVHVGWVTGEQDTAEWISGIARNALGTLDVPLLLRMVDAWSADDARLVEQWSRYLIAARETSELRAEERHMGKALAKVLTELEIEKAQSWIARDSTSYAAMFALAATDWRIDRTLAAQAYVWAWTENQVLAALKLLPIGQSAGQRMLNRIVPIIPDIVEHAATLDDDSIGVATPSHSMASSLHETQYSRLFRS